MEHIKIQVYEIQEPDEAEMLINIGVDHIGSVILEEKEWKQPLIRETVNMVNQANAVSSLIPLFNNLETVFRVIDYYRPFMVHFCEMLINSKGIMDGMEKLVNLQEEIRKRYPDVMIMRSVPIPLRGISGFDFIKEIAGIFEPVSDFFLTDTLLVEENRVDTEKQPVNGFVGITGKTCDWEIASKLVDICHIPVILAGGITPDNVLKGIMKVCPEGVDSCTGTNVLDNNGKPVRFQKDMQKVKQLVKNVRRAETIMMEEKQKNV